MSTIEIIVYTTLAILGAAVAFYEIYDWRTGNHPFQHMH